MNFFFLKNCLKNISAPISKLRHQYKMFDYLATNFLEIQFFLLSSRLSGSLSEQECITEFKLAVEYKSTNLFMQSEISKDAPKFAHLIENKTGVGFFGSRIFDAGDLSSPAFLQKFFELGFRLENQHRKDWEKTFVSLAVEHFGLTGDHIKCLGVGVGTEILIYHFANKCGKVVASDIYSSNSWSNASLRAIDVYNASPIVYRKDNLEVISVDMRSLKFQDSSFDFIWSISAIEHLDSINSIIDTLKSFSKILRVGGYAFISTEWNLLSSNPRYESGCIIFDEVLISYICRAVPGLRLLGPIKAKQSENDLHIFNVNWRANNGKEVPPLYNIFSSGTFITPIVLIFQRVD